MTHEKYPVSRPGGPFDDSAPERLRRMGLQACDGEPDQDALPEPVWWLAGNLKLVEQFSQCFIRRLSEFVEECEGE